MGNDSDQQRSSVRRRAGRRLESRVSFDATSKGFGSQMSHHINRWLLVFAIADLFLLPTNAQTFARSIAFGGAGTCAVIAFIAAWRNPTTRIPLAGSAILVPLAVWVAGSYASLAWSVDPEYSRGQLAREVMDSLLTM